MNEYQGIVEHLSKTNWERKGTSQHTREFRRCVNISNKGFLGGTVGTEPACQRQGDVRDAGSIAETPLWVGKSRWSRAGQPTPVFLPGESHGQRSLVGDSLGSQRVGHDWSDLACMHTLSKNSLLWKRWFRTTKFMQSKAMIIEFERLKRSAR